MFLVLIKEEKQTNKNKFQLIFKYLQCFTILKYC